MSIHSPLWPAELDHIRLDTDALAPLISFYQFAMGMIPRDLDDQTVQMAAPGRRMVLGSRQPGAQPFIAFRLQHVTNIAAAVLSVRNAQWQGL